MNVFDRLRNHFQAAADALESDKTASEFFTNNSDAGTIREDILLQFLATHLPARCEAVKGGLLFDLEGRESKQLDLLVINDGTLRFVQGSKSSNCIDGCYAVISIKTSLTKSELFDALSNIASIPPMSDMTGKLNPLLHGLEHIANLPFKCIFAFDGLTLKTIGDHIEEYYSANPTLASRCPDLIIVNNKYAIVRTGKDGGTLNDGTPVPPNTFYPIFGTKYVGAYSLLYLLTRIQEACNFGAHIIMSFAPYIDKITFHDSESSRS